VGCGSMGNGHCLESSAVIGKNDYEALVGGGTKCSQESS
jgi:hypothetical protein